MVKGSTDSDTCWKYKFAKNRLLLKLLTLVVKEQRIAKKKKTTTKKTLFVQIYFLQQKI